MVGALIMVSSLTPLINYLVESAAIDNGRYFLRWTTEEIIDQAREYAVEYNRFEESLGRAPKRVSGEFSFLPPAPLSPEGGIQRPSPCHRSGR